MAAPKVKPDTFWTTKEIVLSIVVLILAGWLALIYVPEVWNVLFRPEYKLIATCDAEPRGGIAPFETSFSAHASGSPGSYTSYLWTFGDSSFQNTTANSTQHTYLIAGNFSPTLIVIDSEGANVSVSCGNLSVLPKGPDLIVVGISFISRDTGARLGITIPNNEVYHIVPTIRNNGTEATALDENVMVAVGHDGGINAIGPCKTKTIVLNPGEEVECDSPNKGGFGNSEGPHQAFAVVDYTNIVNEPLEGNNNLSINISIGGGGCTDTDFGKNFFVYGETKGLDGGGFDTCLPFWGPEYIAEHYCDGDYAKYMTYQCPGECRDGACVNISINST